MPMTPVTAPTRRHPSLPPPASSAGCNAKSASLPDGYLQCAEHAAESRDEGDRAAMHVDATISPRDGMSELPAPPDLPLEDLRILERIETGAAVGSCPPAPVVFDEPGREGFGLLGEAWRSPRPSLVQTGRLFDVVQAPEHFAAPVLRHLERLGARRGAVFADGDQWHFVVPLGSGFVPPELGGPGWPSPVRYLSGEWITVPPRGARAAGERMRWVTRQPSGQLYTAPVVLFAGFTALRQRPGPWITKGSGR